MQAPEAVRDLVVAALEELKGLDISVLDVREQTSFTDYMVLASGRSDRHVKSLAQKVQLAAKEHGIDILGVEGERGGEWVLVDLNDVVVHVMQPRVREFYQLEKLWFEAPHSREAALP